MVLHRLGFIMLGGLLVGLGVFLLVKVIRKCIRYRNFPLPWEPLGILSGIAMVLIAAGIAFLLTAFKI